MCRRARDELSQRGEGASAKGRAGNALAVARHGIEREMPMCRYVSGDVPVGAMLKAKNAIRLVGAKNLSELRGKSRGMRAKIKACAGPTRQITKMLAQQLVANRKGHLMGDAAARDVGEFGRGCHDER